MKSMKCLGNSVSVSLDKGPAGWLGIWIIRSTSDFETRSKDTDMVGHGGQRT